MAVATEEKVVHIKDGLESIQYLKSLIESIRMGRTIKFACIDQVAFDLSKDPDLKLVDEGGNPIGKDKFTSTSYYFFGDCPMTDLLGLTVRLRHKINRYIDRDCRTDEDEDD